MAGWTPRGVWRGEEGNECTEGFGDVRNGERNADVWVAWMEWVCRKTIAITDCGELKEKILIVCFIRFGGVGRTSNLGIVLRVQADRFHHTDNLHA